MDRSETRRISSAVKRLRPFARVLFSLFLVVAAEDPCAAQSPPTVLITADVTAGDTPLVVHFVGSAAGDPPGPLSFAWDLDGDGFLDDSTAASPTTPVAATSAWRCGSSRGWRALTPPATA